MIRTKQHIKSAVYAVCVLTLLGAFGAATAVQQIRGAGADGETESAENRVLTAFPSLRTEDGAWNKSYTFELEAWFSEHFAMRSELVTAYGKLSRGAFGVSSAQDVILGKDGWLYYTPSVSDVTGIRTLDDNEIAHCVRSLQLMDEYAAAHGAEFVLAVAPNKGSIYPEYLPARYLQTGQPNNLDALMEALAGSGIAVCDWRGALRSQADDRLLYHKLDTHWNNDGAMLGYQTLMQTLSLDDRGFAAAARTETQDWTGDLWKMLSPTQENPDANSTYDIPQTWNSVGRMRSVDDVTINTTCADGEGSLLMFRDSFARALLPMLSQRFAAVTYSRAEAVPLDLLETNPADTVVYERVERELSDLLIHAPQMPAPQREIMRTPDAPGGGVTVKTAESGQYLRIYGLFDEKYADAERVYVTAGGACYEAFPVCEQELLGLEDHCANGFSLLIPAEAFPADGSVRVDVQRGGVLTAAGIAKPAAE